MHNAEIRRAENLGFPYVRQVELDSGMTADAAWIAAADRDTRRALRPTAGQSVQ